MADRLLDGESRSGSTALAQRTPGQKVPWFTQKYPRVWVGIQGCGSSVAPWGLICARDAYDSMVAEGGDPYNVVAAFCISKDKCYVASIPDRHQYAIDEVKRQMALNPKWLQAHGSGQNQLHAEDLAIATASFNGARYPYDTNGGQAFVFVWGLYSGQAPLTNPPRDNYGTTAGERRPCASTAYNRPDSSCTVVLSQLGINWNTSPMNSVPFN